MQPRSLSTRLLASVSVLLVIFFGLTIAALDIVFRDLAERSMRDRLEVQLELAAKPFPRFGAMTFEAAPYVVTFLDEGAYRVSARLPDDYGADPKKSDVRVELGRSADVEVVLLEERNAPSR